MKKSLLMVLLVFIMSITIFSQEYKVGDHEVFLMPTAETMPKGSSYFADYELFILNYTYAVTPRTHIGAFTMFPISDDFVKTITLGVKHRYLENESFKSAAWLYFAPIEKILILGNVFSFGKQKTDFHLGIGAITKIGGYNHWEIVYMGGIKHRISPKVSIMAEYTNFSTLIDADFYGVISIGVRFHMKNVALDVGGFRPLQEIGDLIFLPIVKATIYLK